MPLCRARTLMFVFFVLFASRTTVAFSVHDELTLKAEKLQKDLDLAKPPEEFRLSGIDGRSYTLESFNTSERVSFLSISDTSEICENESDAVLNFAIQKSSPAHRIVLVHSGLQVDRTKWGRKLKDLKAPLILWDPLQILSQRADFQNPGDHLTLDPKKARILSKGRFSDFPGTPATEKKSACEEAPDRGARLADKMSEQDFVEKFAQPFTRACVRCHMFSRAIDYFVDLKSVHGWQAMSLKTLEVGRMPAGYEPNPHGNNDLGYSIDDVRWVQRYLLSVGKDATRIERFSKAYEKAYKTEQDTQIAAITKDLGKPDMILQAPKPVKLRATGDLIYRYMNLSEPFEEDRMIRAVVIDSDMTVIHHAHLIVVPKKISESEIKSLETGSSSAAAAFLKIYGPNSYGPAKMTANGKSLKGVRMDQPIAATFSRPFRFSLQNTNEGVKVLKGSSLAVIFHFESVGQEKVEQPKFRVFFSKPDENRREIRQFTTTPLDFTIPPKKEVVMRSEMDIQQPIRLEKLLVHMHYRGISARMFTREPGSSEEVLVADLPYHLFKLQNFYRFKNLSLKPGSKVITELVFDNTERNVANPYPNRPVRFGRVTLDDEMHFPRIFYSTGHSTEAVQ